MPTVTSQSRRAGPWFLVAWLVMLAVLLFTRALIPVARHPDRHSLWLYWPIRHASLLTTVLVAIIIIAAYMQSSRYVPRLRRQGVVVMTAAILSGFGCAFVVFSAEAGSGPHDYTNMLGTGGQITAAIFVAFVIEQKFLPAGGRSTDLDVVGFAFIVTSMGVAILGSYPIDAEWQASLGAVSCMGAGAGIATLAYRATDL